MRRRQASLFLPDLFQIEAIRFRYNPIQARLIPAHVTLCREDEVTDWDAFQARLESLVPMAITLTFGAPVRENNFVFLPVLDGLSNYHDFRRAILPNEARNLIPHVTLIHPRNGICTDPIFADVSATIISPIQYTFREVRIIEQEAGGVWRVIASVGNSMDEATVMEKDTDEQTILPAGED
ncbi:hypothetical protein SH467x_002835 [Pirellulaceae bacterium SH467]